MYGQYSSGVSVREELWLWQADHQSGSTLRAAINQHTRRERGEGEGNGEDGRRETARGGLGEGEAVRDWETLTCDVGWKGGKGLDMW